MKIFIDAGHNYQGADTGAQGNGLKEQDITFYIAKKLAILFQKNGDQAALSRANLTDSIGTSVNDSLGLRCSKANLWGADLFISLHCNAASDTSACGTEVYVFKEGGKAYELAKKVQKSIVESLGTVNRGVKTANFAVLKNTNMPAMLVELAFITNRFDAQRLSTLQDEFAKAIFDAVTGADKPKELTEVNDIVWELSSRGIISDTELWLTKLSEDKNAYYLAQKAVSYMQKNGV